MRAHALRAFHWRRKAVILPILLALACGKESPTEPGNGGGPPGPTVATIAVSSPVGDIVAVGGTVQLVGVASDAAGQPVATSLSWTVANSAVASVGTAGLLTGAGPGTTRVTASAGSVTGSLDVTVADADLAAIERLLDDELVDALLARSGASETPARAAWSACDAGSLSGSLAGVRDCVADVRIALQQNTDPVSGPLISLISLFVDAIERLLNLP